MGIEELAHCMQGVAGDGCKKVVSLGQNYFQWLNLHRYI